MSGALWLIPVVPLVSAAVLLLGGRRMGERASGIVGVLAIGVCALLSLLVVVPAALGAGGAMLLTQTLWTWLPPLGLDIALRLDALSATMVVTVAVVAFLIHLYSVEHMAGDEGFGRFFGMMNLFVAAMLILVLADNLVLLYLGWEGVGLCSYLLIGFWYRDPNNGRAARKAFIVTRIGDTAMMIGLLLLYRNLGTLHIGTLLARAPLHWAVGAPMALAAALLLLGGAVGKSAQLPLQTWLPDAMAGPTPTSALIHAATMVTAGVYLVARMHPIFTLAPVAQLVVAIVGAATVLLGGASALFQSDIKRVLAYSTMSQVGYMFLALGVGAWSAALFHLMTHACFKALLFLGAGVVIDAMNGEHDIAKMGGLRRQVPLAFLAFVVGGSALAGLPLVTAGFYSKDLILWQSWATGRSLVFWGAGLAGVLLTSLYVMRVLLYVFAGPPRQEANRSVHWPVRTAIYVLTALAIVAGFVNVGFSAHTPPPFTAFLTGVLPAAAVVRHGLDERVSALVTTGLLALGVLLGFVVFGRKRRAAVRAAEASPSPALYALGSAGFGFDWLYHQLFVAPVLWLARVSVADVVDVLYVGLAALARWLHRALSQTQSGRLRTYAVGVALGAILLLALVLA